MLHQRQDKELRQDKTMSCNKRPQHNELRQIMLGCSNWIRQVCAWAEVVTISLQLCLPYPAAAGLCAQCRKHLLIALACAQRSLAGKPGTHAACTSPAAGMRLLKQFLSRSAVSVRFNRNMGHARHKHNCQKRPAQQLGKVGSCLRATPCQGKARKLIIYQFHVQCRCVQCASGKRVDASRHT